MGSSKGKNVPPKSTRFRKGESGNPRGRPKKQKLATSSAFDVVIDKTLTISQSGVTREVTVEEALQHKTYQAAIAGDRTARREILKMIAKREKAMAEKSPQPATVETKIRRDDPSNADEAMLILGIAQEDARWTEEARPGDRKRLLLEPWAVQAALSRRSARKMTKRELDEARRCSHDDGKLRWPEAVDE